MKMDIDKAIAEHSEKFEAMMERHRELMAQQDREIIALRKHVDNLIAGLSNCKLEMRD